MTTRAIRRLRQPSALRPTSTKASRGLQDTHRSWCALITIYRNWILDPDRKKNEPLEAPVTLSWIASFDSFYQDMGERPKGLSLRRKNAALPYSCENCYWGQPRQRGSKPKILLTHNGITRSIPEWSAEVGVSTFVLYGRLSRGKSHAEVLGFQPEAVIS